MKKSRIWATVFVIFLGALIAGAFVFPGYVNRGIDAVNAKKNEISVLQKLPNVPRVPLIPFRLGLDLQGGIHFVYEADLSQIGQGEHDSAMQGLRDVIERRVDLFGVAEPLVQIQGSGNTRRLIVELAGIIDPNEAIQLIGQTPFLEFREPKENYEAIRENNRKVLQEEKGQIEDPFQSTPLTGRFLKKATVGFGNVAQEPIIELEFDDEGAKLFEEITGRNVQRPLAIYLDGQPLQIPVVQEVISGGKAQITGRFTLQEAQRIVRDLNAGALPVPITLISQQNVGPTLGKVSLEQSLRASLFGFLFVAAFMILFYRIPGFIASIALLIYVFLMLASFKFIPVTLTLAGIAGFILSIGMAVDANVLIFSRMREELRDQRSFSGSIEEGFRRAWPSIRDGNVTTLLVGLILFWFGSSFVQGFALTLCIGIFVSMISAIFVTKTFLRVFANTRLERIAWLWR
ncbi:MAG: protein translocase subunit SecD [Patescibacteria group bacterium]